MKKFEIYAPLFHGFYNTIWEPDTEQEECELLHGQTLEFDNKDYQNSIGEGYCDAVKEQLEEYITEIKFLSIESPREYNFTNDKIVCEVKLSKTNLDSLGQLIYDNKREFEEYLKENYTSYDGFISFISSDFEDWEEDTKKFRYFEDVRYLQGVFKFALIIDGIDQEYLYNEVHQSDNRRDYNFIS